MPSPFLPYALAMSTTSTTRIIHIPLNVEINEIQQELTFEFEFTPSCKGSRDFYGQENEPDTSEEMEFLAAYDDDGKEIEIACKQEIECARELAWQEVSND